ncbi:MAG: hypothetical protein M1358_16755 [Chloroflexi bacterium]|nr:hypothetical protein [Chloroflexota bacterium]
MSKFSKMASVVVEHCLRVRAGEEVLILADDRLLPVSLAHAVCEAVASIGAEPSIAIMQPKKIVGEEPPRSVAAAMLVADKILMIHDKITITHTNARKQTSALGIPALLMYTDMGEDYFARDFSLEDLEAIRDRTEEIVRRFDQAHIARLTTPLGTDLTVDLSGRGGLALHPLNPMSGGVPDYAEATICPNEGKSYGTVVIDSHMIGWGYLLREPLKVKVEAGKCVEIEGDGDDARRLRGIVFGGDNSENCPAEFAIGTSHTIPESMRGNRWHAGRCGMVHIAFGRNNDIGGATWSRIHIDGVMNNGTITLDGETILKDGMVLL